MRLPFTVRDRDVQANFDKLLGLLGFNILRKGTGTVTFPGGSAFTSETTVPHGLGTTPSQVLVTSTGAVTHVTVNDVGVTTFDVVGATIDGSTPAAGTSGTFYWIAFA